MATNVRPLRSPSGEVFGMSHPEQELKAVQDYLYALKVNGKWSSAEKIAWAINLPEETVKGILRELSYRAFAHFRTVNGVKRWQQ